MRVIWSCPAISLRPSVQFEDVLHLTRLGRTRAMRFAKRFVAKELAPDARVVKTERAHGCLKVFYTSAEQGSEAPEIGPNASAYFYSSDAGPYNPRYLAYAIVDDLGARHDVAC